MDKTEIAHISDQIDGLISDLESILMDEENEDTSEIENAIDGLKDAERALKSIL